MTNTTCALIGSVAGALLLLVSACGGDEGGGDKCDRLLDAVTECYDGYCARAGGDTPFCGCWTQGLDLAQSCDCQPRNLELVCSAVDLDRVDPDRYECGAATSFVDNACSQ